MKELEEGTTLTLDFSKIAEKCRDSIPVAVQHADTQEMILAFLASSESEGDAKVFRRNWAKQKIYEVDPLVCPKCKGSMRIISSIEDPSVIRAILKHLGIWLVRSRPPPKIHDPPVCMHSTGRPTILMDDVCCQLPIHAQIHHLI